MKLLAFDIEASNLSADFGIVLCVGFREVGRGRTHVLSLLDYDEPDPIRAEKLLLKDVSKVLMDADVWIAHFGRWFDTVFINTRLMYHGLPVLPANFPLIDTWKVVKNHMKLRNNRLVTVQDFLGLSSKKNAITPEHWIRAMAGQKPALHYIINHCRRDVDVLVETYERLKPLMHDHPNGRACDERKCPGCDSTRLQKRGFHVTPTRKYRRYHCQSCGLWTKAAKGE